VAVACTSSRGAAVAARSGVVIAVLASPLVMRHGVAVLVEEPDHIGTAAFLLGAFLLIDRAPGWRFTGPLIGVILWIGQVGDATVRYLAVPAILLVAGYRVLAARKIRTNDTAIAVAAVASVPLSMLTRSVMQHFGAYATVQPPSAISPIGQWSRHLVVTLHALLTLLGVQSPARATALSTAAAIFGLACLPATHDRLLLLSVGRFLRPAPGRTSRNTTGLPRQPGSTFARPQGLIQVTGMGKRNGAQWTGCERARPGGSSSGS